MKRCAAFTLIELLVVVAVIGVLIAILVPSLGRARKVARTAVCGTNLRSISHAMNVYATEWEGAILGNAHTSSCALYNSDFTSFAPGIAESTNVPGVIQTNDWLTPTARIMNLAFDESATPAGRINRFMTFNAFKGFTCPENDVLATAFTGNGGPAFPVHRAISYVTSLCFQYTQGTGSSTGFNNQISFPKSFTTLNVGGYRPKLTLVGNLADKVFIADGARFYSGSGALAVTTNGAISNTSPGGMASDYGPWDGFNRSYMKGGDASGNGRSASMRHGDSNPANGLGGFRMNLGFFDGHVETQNGLDAADPSLWCPTGTVIKPGEITDTEVIKRYTSTPAVR